MATYKGAIGDDSVVRVAVGGGHDGTDRLTAAEDAAEAVDVVAVGPTGVDALAPLVLATQNGETAFLPGCTAERARAAVEALEDGSLPEGEATVEHDPETTSLPTPPAKADESAALGVGSRRVLAGCGWRAPASVADYRAARDGDLAVESAAADPDATRERVRDAGLRGRGRGDGSTDVPISDAWTTAREADGEPVVVVNGNEADDHARADRLLLESAPLAVLDSALSTAHAIDATDVVVYVNDAETLARRRVQEAADALADDRDPDVSIGVVAGPDEYTAGEMTMALEALEGNNRLEARRRPPGPAQYGLHGRPTVIHTPRTFAQIGRALATELGGVPRDPGTRLFTLAGDVDARATIELPTDATLDDARGAVALDGGFKTACVGGRFGGLARDLDVPASAPGLRGARLGTNGVIELFGESTCTVALAGRRAKLAREENCGRCVPCREGSKQLVDLLRDVYDGEYQAGMLRELARTMRETSTCEFGEEASRPVTTAMETFEPEFRAHADGRCPSGTCDGLST